MRSPIKLSARLAITQSELFQNWPAEAISLVLAASDVVLLEKGACLHRPGDKADFLYLVSAGSLHLSHPLASGRRFTTGFQVAGDFHGIGPVISDTGHLYIATCKEPTELVRIPAELFRRLLEQDGRLALAAFAGLYRRYRSVLRMFHAASTASTRARIAELLKSFSARSPKVRPTPLIDLSQSEIASMLGTQRQVVNRELRALVAAGVVRVEYGRIAIVDAKRLKEIAAAG